MIYSVAVTALAPIPVHGRRQVKEKEICKMHAAAANFFLLWPNPTFKQTLASRKC